MNRSPDSSCGYHGMTAEMRNLPLGLIWPASHLPCNKVTAGPNRDLQLIMVQLQGTFKPCFLLKPIQEIVGASKHSMDANNKLVVGA